MSNNVFQVGSSDMFDSVSHTQGGCSHLMQYLWDRYVDHLTEEIEKRKAAGQSAVDIATAKRKAPATHFVTWAADYLKDNRAVESFFIESNLGVRLANSAMVALSPGTETDIRGTMQESAAVQVTEGKTRRENSGTAPGGATMRI